MSVQSPDPSDLGQGWQWFSVRGVSSDNRGFRVAAAMPEFVQAVARWQHNSGVDARHTTLVGFSQGAIMALESTQETQPVAARVVAMAGRFAAPPQRAPEHTRLHLLHGEADGVVPARASIEAHAQLTALHADVTLDLIPWLGRGIDGRMSARLHERLAAVNRWDGLDVTTSPPALQIEVDCSVLLDDLREPVTLRVSPRTLVARHWPRSRPVPLQLERAIDDVENAIEQAGLGYAYRGVLRVTIGLRRLLPQRFTSPANSPTEFSRGDIEAEFSRLVVASGAAADLDAGPAPDGEAAAALLFVREVMHHLGFHTLRIDG